MEEEINTPETEEVMPEVEETIEGEETIEEDCSEDEDEELGAPIDEVTE